jgi:hypothetical protein
VKAESKHEIPKMKILMPFDRFVACELASKGYGTPQQIMEMRADLVLDAFDHLRSMREYEERFYELNAPKGGK